MQTDSQITEARADSIQQVVGRCVCKHDRKTTHIGTWDGCPLEGCGHTNFMLLRCGDCGKICGFPDGNLDIALDHGTLATKTKLRELLSSSNTGTQRPGSPDESIATETRKPGSLK